VAWSSESDMLARKGAHTIFRLYGPLQPFCGKSWKPSDPEAVE